LPCPPPLPQVTVSRLDLPEAAGFEPWQDPPTASQRLFFAAMSPIALFWPEAPDDRPLHSTLSNLLPTFYRPGDPGTARGFALHPFLPVLVESRSGGAWLGWTTDASEFELDGLPAGPYRARALDLFGRVTYASGFYVRAGSTATLATRLWAKVDLDEPDSREVMGFVRWENGLPAEKAIVIMQNSYNFRKLLKRVETDEHGFFRIADVPSGEPYFVFALPPAQNEAMRNFEHFGVPSRLREVWRELTLHPHQLTGVVADSDPKPSLQLVRINPDGERAIWSFHTDSSGRFTIANVPHGRYRVQRSPDGGGEPNRSLPFEVGDWQSAITVRWTSP